MVMTLTDLIECLQEFADQHDPDTTEVRLAHQPQWPFEYAIGTIVDRDPLAEFLDEYGDKPTDDDSPEQDAWVLAYEQASEQPKVIYIAESRQIGYLPGIVTKALCWGR